MSNKSQKLKQIVAQKSQEKVRKRSQENESKQYFTKLSKNSSDAHSRNHGGIVSSLVSKLYSSSNSS
jgi:hypothetical protein